jgi:Uncharacterized protein containing a NRPS condensation (elongation) domain
MKRKSELFDQVQELFEITGFNDHQVHCVIRFERHADEKTMKAAVTQLARMIPMLSRCYVSRGGKSYWQDMKEDGWNRLFQIVKKEEDFQAFTCSKTELGTGPQIRVCLLKSEQDALSIILNHMITDGAGMKQIIYDLSQLYSNLRTDPSYQPKKYLDGDRGFSDITSQIPVKDRLKILLLKQKDNNQPSDALFPMEIGVEEKPFLLTSHLTEQSYNRIKERCKRDNVTVNDVILTAYFRTISQMLNMDGRHLSIPIMVDMRRYRQDKSWESFSNLSSTVNISSGVKPGEDFTHTLQRISKVMNQKKKDYLGVGTFLKLETLYHICGRRLSFKILKNNLHNPTICMTNIGIIDSEQLQFKDSPVIDAFVCGSIKYRPHFQLAVSSFQNTITFCVNLYGSYRDQEVFQEFLKLMGQELEHGYSMEP